jgi:hypothetical protein
MSVNNGGSWTSINSGLPIVIPILWDIIVKGNNIYIATWGNGVWKRPLSDFGISAVSESNDLAQLNFYPNPTTGVITIKGSSAISKLTVQNAVGKTVYSEPNFRKNLKSVIDLTGLPKGIYFIKASSGNQEINRKIVLQ